MRYENETYVPSRLDDPIVLGRHPVEIREEKRAHALSPTTRDADGDFVNPTRAEWAQYLAAHDMNDGRTPFERLSSYFA